MRKPNLVIKLVVGKSFFFPVRVEYRKEYGQIFIQAVEYKKTARQNTWKEVKNFDNHFGEIANHILSYA